MFLSHSSDLAPVAAARQSRTVDVTRFAALAIAGSLFVALCAHIAVQLPFTPVPFTLQPFAVLLVGMLLGPRAGFAAMALYLCEGAAGLPVFTPLGLPGIARLLGPTAGYLFAYPVAAAVAGAMQRLLPMPQRFALYALGGFLAMSVIYGCGAWWFSQQMHLSLGATLGGSVLPFALSDAVKVLAAAGIASAVAPRDTRA